MKHLNKLFIAAVLILATSHSFAGSINERQANQKNRIAQGVVSGELTKRETVKLAAQQHKLARKEARFRSDGELSARERVNLQRSLNRSSANIYRKKHNDRDRN